MSSTCQLISPHFFLVVFSTWTHTFLEAGKFFLRLYRVFIHLVQFFFFDISSLPRFKGCHYKFFWVFLCPRFLCIHNSFSFCFFSFVVFPHISLKNSFFVRLVSSFSQILFLDISSLPRFKGCQILLGFCVHVFLVFVRFFFLSVLKKFPPRSSDVQFSVLIFD